MQRVRDEAHRFAINYHRKLRAEAVSFSLLDEIPGIGDVIKTKLLRAFGSVDEISKADEKALLNVIKNKSTVKKIIEVLHK
jgi:excinuclease ABC subunit C